MRARRSLESGDKESGRENGQAYVSCIGLTKAAGKSIESREKRDSERQNESEFVSCIRMIKEALNR